MGEQLNEEHQHKGQCRCGAILSTGRCIIPSNNRDSGGVYWGRVGGGVLGGTKGGNGVQCGAAAGVQCGAGLTPHNSNQAP